MTWTSDARWAGVLDLSSALAMDHSWLLGQAARSVSALRVAAFISDALQRHDVASSPFDQREHMLAPAHQRRSDGALVARSVINSANASAKAAEMIERRLNVMRLYAEVRQAGGDSAP